MMEDGFNITAEDWIEYRKNATEYLEMHTQFATKKAVQIAIDKQIPQRYMMKLSANGFVERIICPKCEDIRGIKLTDDYCPYCGQALMW